MLPSRLPPHELALAMTIHKSQGSELDEVLVVLPDPGEQSDARGVSRELVYTGLTRAKRGVRLAASRAAVRAAIGAPVARGTGLREALEGVL